MKTMRRAAVTAIAASICIGLSAPPAQAVDPGASAAGWLSNQASDGGFDNPGLTADAVFGYVSNDVGGDAVDAALASMDDAGVLADYLGDETSGYQAAQTAKVLLAVHAGGGNTADFGGLDLEATLRGLENADGLFTGGFESPIGQSFAILALTRSASGVSTNAVDTLVAAQCDDGGFGFELTGGACAGDVDVTGYAVSALLSAGETTASSSALDWLESQQGASGGFVAGYPGAPENTNSTGLAGQALASGGRDAAANAATEFIEGLQVGCDGDADAIGAIAYDASGYDPATAVMATAQAMPALAGEGLAELDRADDVSDIPALDCSGDGGDDGSDDGANPRDPSGKLPATGSPLTLPLTVGAAAVVIGLALFAFARARNGGRA